MESRHITSGKSVRSHAHSSSKSAPPLSPNSKANSSMLRVVATDAAAAATRRSSIRSSHVDDLGHNGQSCYANKVAEWGPSDIVTFARGLSTISFHHKEARRKSLTRAFLTWRMHHSTRPNALDAPRSHEAEEKTHARLDAILCRELILSEKLAAELNSNLQLLENDEMKRSPESTMRFLILQWTAGLKRAVRFGFLRWLEYTRGAREAIRTRKLRLEAELRRQHLRSLEHERTEALRLSEHVTDLLQRAKAFFFWKSLVLGELLQEEMDDTEIVKRQLFHSLQSLRGHIQEQFDCEKRDFQQAIKNGLEVIERLEGATKEVAGALEA